MSDTAPQEHASITPDRKVNARELSRHTGALLRQVGFEGRSFAVEHCGRIVAFLIPANGRVPVKRGRKVVYEVPEPEPLLELNDIEASIVGTLYRSGRTVTDRLMAGRTFTEVALALATLEATEPPLIVRSWGGYDLTDAGVRHAEELGL